MAARSRLATERSFGEGVFAVRAKVRDVLEGSLGSSQLQELSRENPFGPQRFSSYRHAFKGLATQGLAGFYKGNLLGVLHNLLTTQGRFLLLFPLQQSERFRQLDSPLAQTAVSSLGSAGFGFLTLLDVLMQPLHNLQSRFVLQKLASNSRAYYSVADAVVRHGYSLRPFLQVASGD